MSTRRVVIVGGGFAGLRAAYDTAFRICEELGLPLVESQMIFGHHRNGRWVTTTPEQSLGNFIRQLPAALAMGFLSPSGLRAGSKVMRQMYRQKEYLSFASDSRLSEIDDDPTQPSVNFC